MIGFAHRLRVFISSTADLTPYRDAAEATLCELEIEGSRFEAWPSSPRPSGGLGECIHRVDETDAFVVILGSRYGTVDAQGLSATHIEYRRSIELGLPTFCFILESNDHEPSQEAFIAEVERSRFRGPKIKSPDDLKFHVRRAFLNEFTRCFREVHCGPPKSLHSTPTAEGDGIKGGRRLELADDRETAEQQLFQLYTQRADAAIRQLSPQILLRFRSDPSILNILYMAEVNLGMNHGSSDQKSLEAAVEFWSTPELRSTFAGFSLDFNRGNALTALGRHEDAIAAYKAALSIRPDYAECWKNLATSYSHLGDRSSAQACLQEAVRNEPRLWEARYSLATFAIEDGDYESALKHLDAIVDSALPETQRSWALGCRARAAHELGETARAIRDIEDAIDLAPSEDWPWLWAARFYAIARRKDNDWLDKCRRFGERFISRFPESGEGWGELGYVYWQMRLRNQGDEDSDKCKFAFAKAIEFEFLDGGLIPDRLGHLQSDDGDIRGAEASFRLSAEQDPAQFGYCLGCCLLQQEKYADALPWLEAAAKSHQPDALSWNNLGYCYDRSGDMDKAIECYERARALEPDYAQAWYHLGGMHWNKGNVEAAYQVWQGALERFPDHELASQVQRILKADE